MRLTNSEVLALCKILLDSRAFTKHEMVEMLENGSVSMGLQGARVPGLRKI